MGIEEIAAEKKKQKVAKSKKSTFCVKNVCKNCIGI